LITREAIEDQLTMEQTEFDRHIAQQRLVYQFEALRLAEGRLQQAARFQEARLGIGRRTKLQWAMHLLGLIVVNLFKGLKYVIRRALP
jgi:hypothetical protein